MLAPLLGVIMMTALSAVFIQLTQRLIDELNELHERGFEQALAITAIGNRLAINHANIYRLLGSVSAETDEGEFYDLGKPLLLEIHDIGAELKALLRSKKLNKPVTAPLGKLVQDIDSYRVTTTNAMLMATVDITLSQQAMAKSTAYFNGLNAEFLTLNELVHQNLSQQMADHRVAANREMQLFVALLAVTVLIMLVIGGVLANFLSRDLNHLVRRLSNLVAWNADYSKPVDDDEVATLSLAIDRVRESYESLDQARVELDFTNRQLNESHNTIREREKTLEELNETLRQKVDEQEEIIRKQQLAEISRDKALEEAERASRVKSEFLATMSHELRTPLNAIIGFSDMIRNATFGPIRQRYQEYADHIHLSGEHLLRLISDVLDISRIEGGTLRLSVGAVDISDVFSACRTLLEPQADVGRVKMTFEVEPDLPAIRADRVRLKQIMLNLIGNAIKFTPPGGQITVRARLGDGADDMILSVRDTGVGIAPEHISTALEKFGQVRNDAFTSHEGVGIGLTLSKYLVETLGGALQIESVVGKGTEVFVRFPLVPGDA